MKTGIGLAWVIGLGSLCVGCGDNTMANTGADSSAVADMAVAVDMAQPRDSGDMAQPPILKHESKSGAIAISDDDRIVAAVSPDDDRVYLIDTKMNNAAVTVQLAAGAEPRSIAYGPDYSFWVANRGNNTVVQITGIATNKPVVGTPIAVASEPVAIAVAPAGSALVVACYADGLVEVVDTSRTMVVAKYDVAPNPRAIVVTNNGSGDDSSETAFITLMFGQPVGGVASEGNDTGKQGIVLPLIKTGVGAAIKLSPIADTTFQVPNKANPPVNVKVGAYPNQLQSIAFHNGRVYVPSTAASPAGPVNFAGNVHPVISVFDAKTMKELPFGASGTNANTACGTAISNGATGYAAGTIDLAIQTRDLNGMTMPPPVLFPTIPVDIAFVPRTTVDIAYVLSMASDEVMRVAWDYGTNTACAGAANQKAINLQAMPGDFKAPIGIVIRNDESLAYVNSWAGREVEIIDLASQSVSARIALSAQPSMDPEKLRQTGKKLFWTSTGRWSKGGWGSCGACHPDGLSDNVTFVFATGPRQTLPLDSDFGKTQGGKPDLTDQRILNWTAIFDEIHDFENNTRGVSGGLGAVVSTTNGMDTQVDLTASGDQNVNGSVKALVGDAVMPRPLVGGGMGQVNTAVGNGWNAIEAYVSSLRSMKHVAAADADMMKVMQGRTLFESARCTNCHAGAKWTVSRRNYTPTQGKGVGSMTCTLQTSALAKKMVPTMGANKPQNIESFHLQTEHPTAKACAVAADCGAAPGYTCVNGNCVLQPQRVTCSLRNVGTFGGGAQGASFEVRSDTDAMGVSLVAEGANGFNVPSLFSLPETAPYFHNGAAPTLKDLLTNAAFKDHLTAGNPNFAPTAAEVDALVLFLQSIDQMTPTFPIDNNFDLCVPVAINMTAMCTNP